MSRKNGINKSQSPVYQLVTKLLHSFRRWASPDTPINLRHEGLYELRIQFKMTADSTHIKSTDILDAQLYDLVIKKEGMQ